MATVRIKNSYLGDRKPQGIEKNLFELFEEYLQPLSTTSPGTAAQKVNDLFPDHRSEVMEGKLVKESPEGFLWELWCQLFDIAGQLPRDSPCQERLAELVKALSTIRTSTTVEIRGSNITLWESLPSLTLCAREELNSIDSYYRKDLEFAQDDLRWENFHAFVARLTRDGTADFSLYAIWALGVALEAKQDHRARAYHEQGPGLDFRVPAAADWISLAGAKLFASNKDFGGAGQVRWLWKGKGGFCKERWELWKSRFKEVSEFEQPSQNTRDIAKRAAEDMEKIENQAGGVSLFEVD